MKKIIFIICIFMSIVANAQIAKGEYVDIQKVSGVGHTNCIQPLTIDGKAFCFNLQLIRHSDGNNKDMYYYNIPANGKMLFKLDNDSIINLQKLPGDKEHREYQNMTILGYWHTYSTCVNTYALLGENGMAGAIQPLLDHAIVKVRVELVNGECLDIDINKPTKFHKKFIKSYETCIAELNANKKGFESGF